MVGSIMEERFTPLLKRTELDLNSISRNVGMPVLFECNNNNNNNNNTRNDVVFHFHLHHANLTKTTMWKEMVRLRENGSIV